MTAIVRIAICSALCAIASRSGAHESASPTLPSERCDKWEQPQPKDAHGRTVVVVEEGCSGLANGTRVVIDLVLSDGTRTTIFTYQDASWNAAYYGQTTPTLEWIGDNRLRISIGAVAAIEKKSEKLGDIYIEYNIGHVLYK